MAPLVRLALAAVAACGSGSAALPIVPHVTGAVTIDGEWNEPEWAKLALRRQFVGGDGELARPSSDVRVMRDDDTLYVGLYAADDDLESASDAFDLVVGELALRIDVRGRATPDVPGVRVGIDRDGTLDDASNYDEEWVLEVAIPRARVGSGALLVAATRCDTPRQSARRCGGWAGMLDLR